MKSNVLTKICVSTLLCLIVLLTLFAFGQSVCAEESAPADVPSEGETVQTPAGDGGDTPSEDADAADDGGILDLHFDKNNVIAALNIMWRGVLAIFITIAIIIVVSLLMNKACNAASEAVKKKQERLEDQMRNEENENKE
ncbi:MAG TPA: hypothetical protein IAB15_01820 [Candidatus Ornithoclostridium faecigallinarum]|nr:hypothetical protein [Candidatus Ornithoclostridium faecigallinarum]